MAGTIRCFSRMNLTLLTSNVTRQFVFNGARTLYTEESLGMDGYRSTREMVANRYRTGIEAFHSKMARVVENESETVLTEDLKAFLHIAEKSPEQVEVLKNCLQKYHSQSSDLRFSSFKFGPVIMRALHYLNEPELAEELFFNPSFDSILDQNTTLLILVDLLYNNGKYQNICDVYEKIMSRLGSATNHPKMVVIVVSLACYKLNTPESFEFSMKIWKDVNSRGSRPVRRFTAILAAHALKQNKPLVALELIETCRFIDYMSIRSIKITALAELDKVDDIILCFQDSLRLGQSVRSQYCGDSIAAVESMIARLQLDESAEIGDLLKVLKDQNYVSDMTLEEHIQRPISSSRPDQLKRSGDNQSWSQLKKTYINTDTFARRSYN